MKSKKNNLKIKIKQLIKEGIVDLSRRQTKKWTAGIPKPGALARFLKDR